MRHAHKPMCLSRDIQQPMEHPIAGLGQEQAREASPSFSLIRSIKLHRIQKQQSIGDHFQQVCGILTNSANMTYLRDLFLWLRKIRM
jgi:hypothetical protein